MLTVADYELIRRKFFVDGESGRSIAKELGHSRKTVAKAIAEAVPPGYRLKEPRKRPAIERYRPIIDAWLEEDQSRPRKQRHTAERIYERLRDEHGYGGSASSVRRYVAWRKRGQGEVFVPLCFAPGEEAQVDWGEATVIEGGVERKVQLFCMKLCHSHAVFVRAYERANLESFLDGHVRAFAFFGGVPKRIAYDNLKSAVVVRGPRPRAAAQPAVPGTAKLVPVRQPVLQRGQGERERARGEPREAVAADVPHAAAGGRRTWRRSTRSWPRTAWRNWTARIARGRATGRCGRRRSPACCRFRPSRSRPAWSGRASWTRSRWCSSTSICYSVPVRWAHHPCVLKGFVDRVEIYCEQQSGGGASAGLRPGAVRAGSAALSAAFGAETGLFGPGPAVPGQPLGRGLRLVASGVGVPLGRRGNAAVHPGPAVDDGASRRGGAAGGGASACGGGRSASRRWWRRCGTNRSRRRCGGWTWPTGPSWPAWARASGRRACTMNWPASRRRWPHERAHSC